jgi:hypothetical protein
MTIYGAVRSTAMFLVVVSTCLSLPEEKVTLSLDGSKPFVFIQFDHAGPRPPVEDDEPAEGIWLRLVNNSFIPIEVETMETNTSPKLLLLPDGIVPRTITIPDPRSAIEGKMPSGYASGLGTRYVIEPGKELLFSVPKNHVGATWHMQVPFRFVLPSTRWGVQPLCFAQFSLADIPRKRSDKRKK